MEWRNPAASKGRQTFDICPPWCHPRLVLSSRREATCHVGLVVVPEPTPPRVTRHTSWYVDVDVGGARRARGPRPDHLLVNFVQGQLLSSCWEWESFGVLGTRPGAGYSGGAAVPIASRGNMK
jgi:hypothetical protein